MRGQPLPLHSDVWETTTEEGDSDHEQIGKTLDGEKEQNMNPDLQLGDYVLATKYSDGDPGDHWAIGFYAGLTNAEKYNPPRYDVVDANGSQFRGNGFRRVKKISKERGEWMLKHSKIIATSGMSVWHCARCSMKPKQSP